MINIPASIVTDIASTTRATIDGAFSIIILLVSVTLAFYIIRKVVKMFPHR